MFTDVAPPGFVVGKTYYCRSMPDDKTATFATDQGSLQAVVTATDNWAGLANYRYPGSANDDSAIYADIVAGISMFRWTTMGLEGRKSFANVDRWHADLRARATYRDTVEIDYSELKGKPTNYGRGRTLRIKTPAAMIRKRAFGSWPPGGPARNPYRVRAWSRAIFWMSVREMPRSLS